MSPLDFSSHDVLGKSDERVHGGLVRRMEGDYF